MCICCGVYRCSYWSRGGLHAWGANTMYEHLLRSYYKRHALATSIGHGSTSGQSQAAEIHRTSKIATEDIGTSSTANLLASPCTCCRSFRFAIVVLHTTSIFHAQLPRNVGRLRFVRSLVDLVCWNRYPHNPSCWTFPAWTPPAPSHNFESQALLLWHRLRAFDSCKSRLSRSSVLQFAGPILETPSPWALRRISLADMNASYFLPSAQTLHGFPQTLHGIQKKCRSVPYE